jgi:predicted nucleotidyltransferase
MRLHDRVQQVVEVYLEAVDDEAQGLVEGLYLVGSTALGEFRPRTSDIDFLAVTADPPDATQLAALARAHGRLRRGCPRPFFDGRYVTWSDLARDPRDALAGPYTYEGRFHVSGRGDCDPVAWHTLAAHGIPCRGPVPADIAIWTDRHALTSWTLGNFGSYWQPLLRRARRPPDPWSLTAFTSYGAVWVVLGVCRLHYTLATGQIASKETAGCHGLQRFPERWHRVLNEALRIRRADQARPSVVSAIFEMINDWRIQRGANGSLYTTPTARRHDVLAFADMVIADCQARPRRQRVPDSVP